MGFDEIEKKIVWLENGINRGKLTTKNKFRNVGYFCLRKLCISKKLYTDAFCVVLVSIFLCS